MRVVVLFNRPVLRADHPEYDAEEWVRTAVADVVAHLEHAGHEVIELGVGRELGGLADRLASLGPDVVFNLFEGLADRPESEIAVARLLERLGLAVTGSGARTLRWSLNKHLGKRRLAAAGLPVAWSIVLRGERLPSVEFPWPVIVKPARRDSSEGIGQVSVVTSRGALVRQVRAVLQRYGAPVMVEQFLEGREFTVALVEGAELTALPASEIVYREVTGVRWPLLTYAAKWLPDSPEYEASDVVRGVKLPSAMRERIERCTKMAFEALECRDYARVDLRLSAVGEPTILEMNANPDLSPSACFAKALEFSGMERGAFVVRLVERAAARGGVRRAVVCA